MALVFGGGADALAEGTKSTSSSDDARRLSERINLPLNLRIST